MERSVTVRFKYDNAGNDVIQKIVLSLIAITLILLILTRTLPFLLAFLTAILFGILNSTRIDGKLIFDTEKKRLSIKEKEVIILFEEPFVSISFNWQYVPIHIGQKVSNGSKRSSYSNLLQLQGVVHLQNGKNIILLHDLYPWQDSPEDWNYGLPEQGGDVRYVDGSLRKLRKMLSS